MDSLVLLIGAIVMFMAGTEAKQPDTWEWFISLLGMVLFIAVMASTFVHWIGLA